MSTQPLNIISRYGEDDISLWMVNVEFEDYKRVAGNAVQLKVELSRYLHRGSPPHTRGKGSLDTAPDAAPRITPAHAGKSDSRVLVSLGRRDHPRTRGEKRRKKSIINEHMGSPPHTRGKGFKGIRDRRSAGITPAHAGKSRDLFLTCTAPEDHPRTRGEKEVFAEKYPEGEGSRGEKRYRRFLKVTGAGSPPHTRGKVSRTQTRKRGTRITPAHAGKRKPFRSLKQSSWDHPRTRGEKLWAFLGLVRRGGSPPHTRGKAFSPNILIKRELITPAHAGKSLYLSGGNVRL